MFNTFFTFTLILGIIIETLIYRRLISSKSKPLRIVYLCTSIVIPAYTLVAFLYNGEAIDNNSLAGLTWAIWLFMLNFLCKFFFMLLIIFEWIRRKRFARLNTIALCISGAIFSVMLYGATWGRNALRVERVEIYSERVPESFDGYTIAHFSDPHLGNLSLSSIVQQMVETINSEDVDLIVQSGDLVHMHYGEVVKEYQDQLLKMKGGDGVCSGLGNHDLGFYLTFKADITPREAFDSMRHLQKDILGWELLENQSMFVHRGGDSIAIAGVTYPKNMNHNNLNSYFGGSDLKKAMNGVSDSCYSVMVSHTPVLFDSVPEVVKTDLMLSGHTHAMQAKVSFGGWQWSPAEWLYKQYSGLYSKGEHNLYVNDGLGYVVYPMRLGTRPELTLITLRHK